MYRPSTYFYWYLIWCIKIYRYIEYLNLRLFRGLINKLVVWSARKIGIIISYGDDDSSGPVTTTLKHCHRIRVHHPNTFIRIINQGSVGVGESYMEGWWECDSLEDLMRLLLSAWNRFENVRPHPMARLLDWICLYADETPWETKSQTGWSRSLGSEYTKITLGPNQSYNAGIWNDLDRISTNLESAQLEAMRQLGEHLKLSPGMKVLELGCGFGALARYLADTHGVFVTGVTHSLEESIAANEYGHRNIEIIHNDCRELPATFEGKYDRVIAVHLMEHLGGPRHYKPFFQTVSKYLKSGGLFCLQTYVMCRKNYLRQDQLVRKYFYSSSVVPHYLEVMTGIDNLFLIEKVQNLSENLDPFYSVLNNNFENSWHLLQPRYEIKYYRLMKLATSASIAMARGKKLHDWVFVFSKIEPKSE